MPHRSYALQLRTRLLEEGLSLLGVHFLLPAQLRATLLRQINMQLPLREHLRLLVAIAAEECMQLPAEREARKQRTYEPDYRAAKSVARGPDYFLRALDQLSGAG